MRGAMKFACRLRNPEDYLERWLHISDSRLFAVNVLGAAVESATIARSDRKLVRVSMLISRKDIAAVTYVDETTVTLSVEVDIRAGKVEAVVIGAEDTRLQADRGEQAHLVGLRDLVAHVVADRGLVGLSALGHLVGGGLGESLTSLGNRKVS
jgi:hypothetical protein